MFKKINNYNKTTTEENDIITETEKIKLILESLIKSGNKMTKEQILRLIETICRKIK